MKCFPIGNSRSHRLFNPRESRIGVNLAVCSIWLFDVVIASLNFLNVGDRGVTLKSHTTTTLSSGNLLTSCSMKFSVNKLNCLFLSTKKSLFTGALV